MSRRLALVTCAWAGLLVCIAAFLGMLLGNALIDTTGIYIGSVAGGPGAIYGAMRLVSASKASQIRWLIGLA